MYVEIGGIAVKRELLLKIGEREVNLVASRDGQSIVIERGDERWNIEVIEDKVVGQANPSDGRTAPAQVYSTNLPPTTGTSTVTSPRSALVAGQGATAAGGSASSGVSGAVQSPMTGIVDQVLVKDGSSVAEGEKIVILEAMKMYIDVTAPVSGTVSGVTVSPGDSVKEGQTLLTIG